MLAMGNLSSTIAKLPQKFTDEEFEACIEEMAKSGSVLLESFRNLLPERHGLTGLIAKVETAILASRNHIAPIDSRATGLTGAIGELTRAIASNIRMDEGMASAVREAMRSSYELRAELIRRRGRQ